MRELRGIHTVASVMTKPAAFEHKFMSWSTAIIFLTRDTRIIRTSQDGGGKDSYTVAVSRLLAPSEEESRWYCKALLGVEEYRKSPGNANDTAPLVEFEVSKFCKPLDESMVALGLDVDIFHEGGTGREYREYGAEHKGVTYVASHAARRGVNETRDPLAQLGSDPIWK